MAIITVQQIREDVNVLLSSTIIYKSEEHGRSQVIGILKPTKEMMPCARDYLYLQCVSATGQKFRTHLSNCTELEIN